MSFSERDILFHKGLMKLLDEARFDLKAREVGAFIQVYNWAKDLPKTCGDKPKSTAKAKREVKS